MGSCDPARVKELVRDIPGFPRAGVTFKDITPLLADAEAFTGCVDTIAEHFAHRVGAAFVPVRKKGKLPWHVHSYTYELEYGTDTLEVHTDALRRGERALIVDDVLATGGTALATWRLVERLGAEAVGFGCVLELGFLGGRSKLAGLDLLALVSYE
jgi:adenine phosphoribosyltransferase